MTNKSSGSSSFRVSYKNKMKGFSICFNLFWVFLFHCEATVNVHFYSRQWKNRNFVLFICYLHWDSMNDHWFGLQEKTCETDENTVGNL